MEDVRSMSILASGHFLRWFARPLIPAVLVLAFFVAAIGLLGAQYWRDRQALNNSLDHSREVFETFERLRSIIADLEAERHGYLLTLDPAYLKAYGVSDESVRRQAEALQALVVNDPLQSLRAEHLALTLSAKLKEIDDIVKTAARESGLAARAMIRGMEDIRSQIDLMVDHQRLLQVDLEKSADQLEQRRTRLTIAAVVIVAALAGTALALARIEARQRRMATDENIQLHSDLLARERKIRRLFDSNIIGIIIWDLEGRIFEANDAFLRIVGYDREDLAAGRLHRKTLTPPEWHEYDALNVAELERIGTLHPFEKEYFRKDGSRVPVLIGGAMFEENVSQGVGFVLDLSELKRAEAEARENERRYREALMEIAHSNRVTTMGELTASIAHEISQPIAATVANARAGLNWLGARPPNLEEVGQTLGWIISDGMRASEIISRIRALVKNAPPQKEELEINQLVGEVMTLTRSEVLKNGVTVRTQFAEGLPSVQADRVQLQQVVLNLIINAVEAMNHVCDGSRELFISTSRCETSAVVISVRDSGPGLEQKSVNRVFEPFYTTKAEGMGMGLAICQSIIAAHGGKMWAGANEPRGAVFQFTLPLADETAIVGKVALKPATIGASSAAKRRSHRAV
jgi:PAS domain S-box-containing protein